MDIAAAREWVGALGQRNGDATDVGDLFLTLAGKRCPDLRGYWNLPEGATDVPEARGR